MSLNCAVVLKRPEFRLILISRTVQKWLESVQNSARCIRISMVLVFVNPSNAALDMAKPGRMTRPGRYFSDRL
ncbi:hypothetical protein [Pseudosulfitobacter sp. SM2401]|uniref:hypothetical protein n=1 Tax=Pseudosulfitobacter sp. SM2401 TaxID=3350098 RepID=UPI0036F229B9